MQKKILNMYISLISRLARFYIKKKNPTVIWVTGSVGKTSCRMIIYQTLKAVLPNKYIYTSPKNFNWEIGTALSIFEIEKFWPNPWLFLKSLSIMIYRCIFNKPKYDIILIEYWIDHIGEMDLQLWIVKPDIAIWTGVDNVHAANYPNSDPKYIAQEKSKLPLASKKLVYLNQNDKYCLALKDKIKVDLFMFDTSNGEIDKASNIYINHNLTWTHNISYIKIWSSIAEILKFQLWYSDNKNTYDIKYDLQAGRYTIFDGINDSIIIDSTYNWSPKSTKATIDQVFYDYDKSDYILSKWYKYILVLWEMRELGENSQAEHEKLMQYIYDLHNVNLDKLVLVSGDMSKYGSETAKNLGLDFVDMKDSLTTGQWLRYYLLQNTDDKYIVLFKSSQWQIYLEEAIKYILADKMDISKLCRQDDERIKIKKRQNKLVNI